MKRISIFIIAITTLLLQACGFHLKGQYNYAPAMSPLFVDSENEEFKYELYDLLEFGNVTITEDINEAAAVVQFLQEDYKKRSVTLDATGQASRYSLNYRVRYRVVNIDGELLLEETTNSTSRTLDYSPTQQLQADEEEDELKEDMFEDIANTVARRLSKVTGNVVTGDESRF